MNDSLLAIGVRQAGVLRGARAASVVISWALAVQDLGHELGSAEGGHVTAALREYRDYWKISERTSWRELESVKLAYGEESPARLAAEIRRQCDIRAMDKDALMTAPLQFA